MMLENRKDPDISDFLKVLLSVICVTGAVFVKAEPSKAKPVQATEAGKIIATPVQQAKPVPEKPSTSATPVKRPGFFKRMLNRSPLPKQPQKPDSDPLRPTQMPKLSDIGPVPPMQEPVSPSSRVNIVSETNSSGILKLSEVLFSVSKQYPPYLSALIERDIVMGRLRSSRGVFDLELFAKIISNTSGFYEATTQDVGFERYLGRNGSTVFGGYKRTDGFLPDYYNERRTNAGGTPYLGIRLPLMKDGSIDKRRATLMKTKLERRLVEPQIRQQSLAFSEAAMKAYFAWLSAGLQLRFTEQLLQVAIDRDKAIDTQIKNGLSAPAVALENRQLVVSREISKIKALREFEMAGIALSLFYRGPNDNGVIPNRSELPARWPEATIAILNEVTSVKAAVALRPEIKQYELELAKLNIDSRFYRNQLLPKLDAKAEIDQSIDRELYKDKGEFELKLGLEFRLPVQRNKARGDLQENRAKIEQTALKARFAVNKITAETRNAIVVIKASYDQIELTEENADLAAQLLDAETARFELGATDLLALNIRERAALEARLSEIKAHEEYFKAVSELLAAIGTDFSEINTVEELNERLPSLAESSFH